MLAFLMAIRHPKNERDPERSDEVLSRTLASICRQDVDAFRLFLVGNVKPRVPLPAQAEFVEVDFAPPSGDGPMVGRSALLADKGSKLAVGLTAARRHLPTHVMMIDSDDLVSRRVAGLVAAHPQHPGWFVERGYVWTEGAAVVRRSRHFHRICGSSHVVRADLLPAPPGIDEGSSKEEILHAFGPRLVTRYLGGHRDTVRRFREAGTPLSPLPFPGGLYVIGTGENYSGRDESICSVPLREWHAEEFGLPLPSLPAAVHQSVRSFLPGPLYRYGRSRVRGELVSRQRMATA